MLNGLQMNINVCRLYIVLKINLPSNKLSLSILSLSEVIYRNDLIIYISFAGHQLKQYLLSKVYQQLSNEAYLNQQQQLEQRFETKSGKGATRHRNISIGVQKMIDVDELPVNGRAVPLSSR